MESHYDVVIVGAGHGGVHLATALVKGGYSGSVALLSDEPDLPYERPPLSKGVLVGAESFDSIAFRTSSYWEESPVHLLCGTRVTEVDPVARHVVTQTGDRIGYGRLVWAAGGRARALRVPGHDLKGVHSIRMAADVRALQDELPAAKRAVIVGGGYIGLETAAAFRKLDIAVTVAEAQPRLLARVTSAVVSDHLSDVHRQAGVTVCLDTGVDGFLGSDGRVSAVRTGDGEELPADLVVVGVGLQPNVEVLAAAGADCGNGVEVDALCRTSLPGVSAIGDCASHVNDFAGGNRVRLESVQNATEQAKVVASDLLGDPRPYRVVPWFWSNQYDVKLKTVGLLAGHDTVVLRGDPTDGAFTAVYLAQGCVIALDCVNRPADFAQGKALVDRSVEVHSGELADMERPLKSLMPRS